MCNGVSNNPVRWAILLLATAVILPTVCLLWFMGQAMKNERIAVRQKLIDSYTHRAEYLFGEAQDQYVSLVLLEQVVSLADQPPYAGRPSVLFTAFSASKPTDKYRGMLIYDDRGRLIFPVIDAPAETTGEPFTEALEAERSGDFEAALAAYRRIADKDPNGAAGDRAQLSAARCLAQLGRVTEAAELARALASPSDRETLSEGRAVITMHARTWLADLYRRSGDEERLLECLQRDLDPHILPPAPASVVVWQLRRSIDLAQRAGLGERLQPQLEWAQTAAISYANALFAAELYPTAPDEAQWPDGTIRRLRSDGDLYAIKFQAGGRIVLGLLTAERIVTYQREAVGDLEDEMVTAQVTDNFGRVIAGGLDTGQAPFLTPALGRFYPEFRAAVAFRDSDVFEDAAGRQTTVYLWTGVLGIGLVLLTGTAAIRTVSGQARMNRLKNDFIATVTHELKTPLSSMRLLVDTLREGRVEDAKSAAEYLELIARENKRLTHLIDNFLTFSRMERGKQVFDLGPVDPAEVAGAAAEAMRAKLSGARCEFTCEVEAGLPAVRADREALTTVLVNLLENACKYTGEDKQIGLRAFRRNGQVCFAVRDNGIGISPRAQRKIFERFYQADRRLSRSAEGCGLGLSIVKYIVDAHKGAVDVESRPGRGSTFTVRLDSV